ncbi:uncharacterized protein LOC130054967 [Ostrea edulis]|uniref:uncharacterized protein LOC130054967 n=1 Tax=Ostrea edulis TaxID=37623 RepID=UPI0024AF8D5D|nr:uncharacterized protein LOC130054967 [Ostrea edulis]
MVISIPEEKTIALKESIGTILAKSKITLKDLQSLVGSLNFCAKAIASARAFNRRFCDAMCGIRHPSHFIRVNAGMKSDLRVKKKVYGSSIIKRAFQRASLSTEKSHLGLRRLNYHILWQGKGGLTWKKLFPRIQLLRRFESLPEILIIHCGGNDIGNVPLLELRLRMKETFQRIWSELPNTLLGWSHILPRFSWRYSKNVKSQNIAVRRINSFMSKLFVVNNGFYISYPEISWDSSGLFVNDGVRLSELGNDLLLFNLQSKLQQVCSFNGERRTRSM